VQVIVSGAFSPGVLIPPCLTRETFRGAEQIR